MVAELLHRKPVGFMELVERVEAPKATVYRHVSKLLKAAVLGVDEDGRTHHLTVWSRPCGG